MKIVVIREDRTRAAISAKLGRVRLKVPKQTTKEKVRKIIDRIWNC